MAERLEVIQPGVLPEFQALGLAFTAERVRAVDPLPEIASAAAQRCQAWGGCGRTRRSGPRTARKNCATCRPPRHTARGHARSHDGCAHVRAARSPAAA